MELCFLVITRRVRPGPSERRLTQPLALPLLPLGAGLEHGAAHRAETRRRAHLRVEEGYLVRVRLTDPFFWVRLRLRLRLSRVRLGLG